MPDSSIYLPIGIAQWTKHNVRWHNFLKSTCSTSNANKKSYWYLTSRRLYSANFNMREFGSRNFSGVVLGFFFLSGWIHEYSKKRHFSYCHLTNFWTPSKEVTVAKCDVSVKWCEVLHMIVLFQINNNVGKAKFVFQAFTIGNFIIKLIKSNWVQKYFKIQSG